MRRVRDLRDSGATYARITSELGIGTSTVSRILGTAGAGRRPRIPPDVRERARQLRVDGMSVPDIAAHLGLARSTAWLLTKDIAWTPGPEGASRRAEAGRAYWRKEQARRQAERSQVEAAAAACVGELTDRDLLLIGAVAYWAEGGKSKPWNFREQLKFTNSDPDMIILFLRWLALLGVDPGRLGFRVSIHESADIAGAQQYWAQVAGVPASQFARATLKKHNPRTVRKNTGEGYHGCLMVTVRGAAREYQTMNGLWSALAAGLRQGGGMAE
ncbi:MAG TPA: hypothetical protein VFQ15_06885 [Jiangellaceae bacterium]|nr:hypothetical protein [Jiangellaceae bacterium]